MKIKIEKDALGDLYLKISYNIGISQSFPVDVEMIKTKIEWGIVE